MNFHNYFKITIKYLSQMINHRIFNNNNNNPETKISKIIILTTL